MIEAEDDDQLYLLVRRNVMAYVKHKVDEKKKALKDSESGYIRNCVQHLEERCIKDSEKGLLQSYVCLKEIDSSISYVKMVTALSKDDSDAIVDAFYKSIVEAFKKKHPKFGIISTRTGINIYFTPIWSDETQLEEVD